MVSELKEERCRGKLLEGNLSSDRFWCGMLKSCQKKPGIVTGLVVETEKLSKESLT